jgi:hypothetical protein
LFATFQDDVTLYFVLEFVIGGEFFTHLRKVGTRCDAMSHTQSLLCNSILQVSLFPNDTAQFYAARCSALLTPARCNLTPDAVPS